MKSITIERRLVTRQYEHVMVTCEFDRCGDEPIDKLVRRANHQTKLALQAVYAEAMK